MLTQRTAIQRSFITALVLFLTSTLPAFAQEPAKELGRFYNQELNFGSCAGYATTSLDEQLYVDPFECAWLEVPLNYDAPTGKTMQIAVLRLPAQGEPSERIGSLVINPGGPGG